MTSPTPILERLATNPNNSDVSTADTIRVMVELAKRSSHSQAVNNAVNLATKDLPNHSSDLEIVRAVYYWIQRNIKFVSDEDTLVNELHRDVPIDGMELLKSPEMLLVTKTGDCDDFSTLLVSMLINLNFKSRFITIAADSQLPWKFSHVYVKTFLSDSNSWIPLDCSHGLFPGWEHRPRFREQEWNV